jgi:hypothetical protein
MLDAGPLVRECSGEFREGIERLQHHSLHQRKPFYPLVFVGSSSYIIPLAMTTAYIVVASAATQSRSVSSGIKRLVRTTRELPRQRLAPGKADLLSRCHGP